MKNKLGATISLVVVVFGVMFHNVSAQNVDWFSLGENGPTAALAQESVVKPYSDYWNIPCMKIPAHKLYYRLYGSTVDQTVNDACGYVAGYGFFTGSNQLQLSGTDTSYKIWDSNAAAPIGGFIAPIPSSNDVILFNSSAYIVKDFVKNIEPVYDPTSLRAGKILYFKFKTNPYIASNKVLYSDGSALSDIKPSSFSFAKEGGSITVNVGRNQAIINTNTRVARRFGATLPSDYTQSTLKTTTGPGGTLVFTSHADAATYTLYDLHSCSGMDAYKIENCTKRNFYTFFQQKIPNFKSIEAARFLNDDSIELYVKIQTGATTTRTDRYTLSLASASQSMLEYLALGDSFASGEGAHQYKPTTDIDINRCHLSSLSYPYIIKNELSINSMESIACSGALLKDAVKVDTVEYSKKDPQGKNKDEPEYDQEIFDNFLPGYRQQVEFVKRNKPEAITLSIGGNNIGFGNKLRDCILDPGTCFSTVEERKKLAKEITAQFDPLQDAYKEVKEASPNTRVYVVGYPKLALPTGNCALNVRLNQEELQLAEDLVSDLNGVIKLAAKRAGVFYVDASDAFEGHRLCEDESWKLAMNGVTAGSDRGVLGINFLGSETYHPNAIGHQLYSATILQQTNGLTAAMPLADESTGLSELESRLVTGPADHNVSQSIQYRNLTEDVFLPGQSAGIDTVSSGYFLKPGSSYSVEIHSEPIVLAQVQALSIEELTTNIVIPESTAPGAHTIHVKGVNINGDPIDIYKNITVIASEEDYDGDGMLNNDDQCQFIEPIGVDEDKDGIDDGCDGEIGQPRVVDSNTSAEGDVVGDAGAISELRNTTNPDSSSEGSDDSDEAVGGLFVNPIYSYSSAGPKVLLSGLSASTPNMATASDKSDEEALATAGEDKKIVLTAAVIFTLCAGLLARTRIRHA